MKNLQQISDSVGNENIKIISDFENARQLKSFRYKEGINFSCFLYKDVITKLELKPYNAYLFTLDKDLVASKYYTVSNTDTVNSPVYSGMVQYFRERNASGAI